LKAKQKSPPRKKEVIFLKEWGEGEKEKGVELKKDKGKKGGEGEKEPIVLSIPHRLTGEGDS